MKTGLKLGDQLCKSPPRRTIKFERNPATYTGSYGPAWKKIILVLHPATDSSNLTFPYQITLTTKYREYSDRKECRKVARRQKSLLRTQWKTTSTGSRSPSNQAVLLQQRSRSLLGVWTYPPDPEQSLELRIWSINRHSSQGDPSQAWSTYSSTRLGLSLRQGQWLAQLCHYLSGVPV